MNESFGIVFGGVLLLYIASLYWVGVRAARQVHSVDDFLLAGRQLPWSIATLTLIATWYGAESLVTVANEVAEQGIRRALLDPFGIVLCLWIAALFVAVPLWNLNLTTIGDLFRDRYGPAAEQIASWILVPSYFGWIAAQLVALATLLKTLYGLPIEFWIVAVAIVGSGYCWLGGMWSVSWTDTLQMAFIVIGVSLLAIGAILFLGGGSLGSGIQKCFMEVPTHHWRVASDESWRQDWASALGVLSIGALGNLPVQDLMQRIMSAKSASVAQRSCWLAGGGYLLLGLAPITMGMVASIVGPQWRSDDQDVLMNLSLLVLHPIPRGLFLLAVVSAILSTFSSAVLSPAAILGRNMIAPIQHSQWFSRLPGIRGWIDDPLRIQRLSIVFVVAASVGLAYQGKDAYELVQESYAIALVGLTIPFMLGLHRKFASSLPAIACMSAGTAIWFLHWWSDWEFFLDPWLRDRLPIPQEWAALAAGGIAFACATLTSSHRR